MVTGDGAGAGVDVAGGVVAGAEGAAAAGTALAGVLDWGVFEAGAAPALGASTGFFVVFSSITLRKGLRNSGFSGSALKIAVLASFKTGRKRASLSMSGWDFSPTKVSKNMKATTAIKRPRAAPKNRPRVRSSVPIAESRISSDSFVVISDTKTKVTKKTAAIEAAKAICLLAMEGAI